MHFAMQYILYKQNLVQKRSSPYNFRLMDRYRKKIKSIIRREPDRNNSGEKKIRGNALKKEMEEYSQ